MVTLVSGLPINGGEHRWDRSLEWKPKGASKIAEPAIRKATMRAGTGHEQLRARASCDSIGARMVDRDGMMPTREELTA